MATREASFYPEARAPLYVIVGSGVILFGALLLLGRFAWLAWRRWQGRSGR